MLNKILNSAERGNALSSSEMQHLLELEEAEDIDQLYQSAYRVKEREVGKTVYLRALIESSNICIKDCYYCGIRHSNRKVTRYQMDESEIVSTAMDAFNQNFRSIVIQSGERQTPHYIRTVEQALLQIKEQTKGKMRVTLSLGEQTEQVYTRWKQAGAERYLLRIETTNPKLYRQIHPESHSLETRKNCLSLLKKTGYQVGSGIMIGLPGQSTADLVNDVLFMKEVDLDMVGMGPYIPHRDTPLGQNIPPYTANQRTTALTLGLKMVAVARLVLRDVNIAATTALETLSPQGRTLGLQCGANVIMPNITGNHYLSNYMLYDNKPCRGGSVMTAMQQLEHQVKEFGESVSYTDWGDSRHYIKRC